MRLDRMFLAILVLIGIFIAWRRLFEQQVPGAEVASTGLLFVALLAAFFLFLLGAGKLIGKLFGGK